MEGEPQHKAPRRGFQEAFEMTRLADSASVSSEQPLQRFISRQPAWKPGADVPVGKMNDRQSIGPGAFGGHVYIQAPLAAARVVEQEDREAVSNGSGKRSIHSIQGVFTNPGKIDRPFVYEVSTVSSSRSFSTRIVNARQPAEPSSKPFGPFPVTDESLPLGPVSFSCIVTFKRPVPSPDDFQQTISPQERYASILDSRAPTEWEPSPVVDIDVVREAFPDIGHGTFPALDMYKVDMTAFNAGKPLTERRQLILYRLLRPLPAEDVNAHVLCHAFEADRNGLIMLGNQLGYGYNMGSVASLSFGFYVHVNADEAVLRGDGWWVQEVYWPRVSAGRGMMETRAWSPEGKHVASGYQDGIILPQRTRSDGGKL